MWGKLKFDILPFSLLFVCFLFACLLVFCFCGVVVISTFKKTRLRMCWIAFTVYSIGVNPANARQSTVHFQHRRWCIFFCACPSTMTSSRLPSISLLVLHPRSVIFYLGSFYRWPFRFDCKHFVRWGILRHQTVRGERGENNVLMLFIFSIISKGFLSLSPRFIPEASNKIITSKKLLSTLYFFSLLYFSLLFICFPPFKILKYI